MTYGDADLLSAPAFADLWIADQRSAPAVLVTWLCKVST
jgi:hypothetical protein